MRRLLLAAIIASAAPLLAGCDQRGSILTLKQAPRITNAAGVQVYTATPAGAEVLGMIEAHSTGGWTHQQHMDSAMNSLKSLAADAGGNGVVLQQFGSTDGGAIITGGVAGAPMVAIPTGGYPVLRGTAILVP